MGECGESGVGLLMESKSHKNKRNGRQKIDYKQFLNIFSKTRFILQNTDLIPVSC